MPNLVDRSAVGFKKRDAFWRSVVVIVTGTVVGQLISVVTLPIISRLYAPSAFGQYALLASMSTLLTIIVTLGLSSAIMAPEDDAAAEQIVVVAFTCAAVLATAMVGVALAVSRFLTVPSSGMPLWQVCLWVYAMTIINSLTALLRVHTNRRGYNRALATNSILSALCTLLIAIPFGLLSHGSLGLILASLIAGLACSIQMIRKANPFRHRISWARIISTIHTYRSYVSYQYAANLMETAGAQVPTQVLGGLYGSAQLGSYSMNERLLGIPLRLVGAPIGTIYFRSISRSHRLGESPAPLTFSIVSKVMLVAGGPMGVLVFWGPELFAWALGNKWREAGTLAGYLVPLYVLTLCRTSVSNCRVVIGHQRANAGISVIRLGMVLLSLVVGHAFFGTVVGAVFTLSVGSALFMIVDMALNFAILRSHLRKYLLLMLAFGSGVLALWYSSGALDHLPM